MAKLNLNPAEFDDEEIIVPPSPSSTLVPTEILPPAAPPERNRKSGNAMEAVMGGLTPMGAFASIARSLTDTASEISRCIAAVSMEKERTKQVKVWADVQIEESRQQTRRVQIDQKEQTKRYRMQCETKLAQSKIELEKFLAEIQLRDAERMDNRQNYMAALDGLEKQRDTQIKILDTLNQQITSETETERLQLLFQQINQINAVLTDISRQILELRRR